MTSGHHIMTSPNEFVCVSQSITNKKDFWAKGLYNGETREVRERSGVFIFDINFSIG